MRKHFYLSCLLLLSFAFHVSAQDTVRVDNAQYSTYEKSLNRKGTFIVEEARELWRFRGIKVESVEQRDQNKNKLASAIRFSNKYAITTQQLAPDKRYAYLDDDEVDSLLQSLELYASMYKAYNDRTYQGTDKRFIFSSRGSIYASCHVNKNLWEVSLTTDQKDLSQYTYFNIKRLREFIEILKLYRGFQPPKELSNSSGH